MGSNIATISGRTTSQAPEKSDNDKGFQMIYLDFGGYAEIVGEWA